MTEKTVIVEPDNKKLKKINAESISNRSYAGVIWKRFKANKIGVFSLCMVGVLFILGFLGPIIMKKLFGYDFNTVDYTALYQPPTAKHFMGTDDAGRDLATLLLFSLRNALIVGFGAGLVELVIGLLVGSVAGFFGGWIDNVLMRFVDIMYGFPSLLFNIILVMILGRNLFSIFVAIGLASWVGMARLVRSQVLAIKHSEYIEAARSIGAKNSTIILKYIIPNAIGPLITALSFSVPSAMFAESGMSLLGIGVLPPTPSWGGLIKIGQNYILSAPYMILFPAFSFAITVLIFSYLGDAVTDAFDTKHSK